jgi:hypothetical protein
MTLNLAKSVVNHHHCKEEVHAEAACEEERCD